MKVILVVWPVHREDWISVFRKMSNDFRFIFLCAIHPQSLAQNHVADFAETVFWSQFKNSFDVIDVTRPDKVVFMSIDTALSTALNIACRRRGIRTFILQHGIYTTYKDYRIREKLWRKQHVASKAQVMKSAVGFSTIRFLKNSLRWQQTTVYFKLLCFLLASRKMGPYWAARHVSFSERKPDFYICFSPENSAIHRELDRPRDAQFIYTGSPELDNYLSQSSEKINEKFFLHIDQAMAENSFGEETVPREKMVRFYHKLNDFCLAHQSKLYIKLHPESYGSTWLPAHDNIVYLKKTEKLNTYIQSAEGCFGFYSTMVIPAVYWKKTILFNVYYSALQQRLASLNMVQVLDFWNFSKADISFNYEKGDENVFKKLFFFETDGRSLNRIKGVLHE
jgi:hypothetical protein